MKGNLLFLGTGGSAGVPMIGCNCSVCRSNDPHNSRLRPSALITLQDRKILIDVGPDFRAQALTHHITHIDGVLLTHTHYDHIAGLDELRSYYLVKQQILPLLVSRNSFLELKKRFYYVFHKKNALKSLSAQLFFQILEKERGETFFLGLPIRYMSYEQGGMQVIGYRLGNLAYVSDIRDFPNTVYEDLQGVKILILSALRHNHSPVHFTVNEAVEFVKKVNPDQAWFMHISHELDHEKTNAILPEGIKLAYDGLTIEFDDGR